MPNTHATSQANHRRFIEKVLLSEVVWAVRTDAGLCPWDSTIHTGRHVLPFWSDAAYAHRAASQSLDEVETASIDLFDFIFRCLPEMQIDGHLAGTNWTDDLAGWEIEPLELQEELMGRLSQSALERFEARFSQDLEDA